MSNKRGLEQVNAERARAGRVPLKVAGVLRNKSGLEPVEFKILVQLDKVADRTEGGLWIPATLHDQQQMSQAEAILVAVGGNAFEDWEGTVPKVGDHIYVAKLAGYGVTGIDGEKYRLMNDKDIAAVIKES